MPEDATPHSAIQAPAPVPGSRRTVLAAVMAMMFMIAIEGTIVATAMPTIVGALGDFDLFSWVFTAYLLTQAVTVPIYGRLADLYGRKRILFVGMALFLAASLLCGLAWGMVPLIAFRAAQGIGAGALLPVGMTIVADLYSPVERARIQAYVSSVWVIAAILAPILGAFLVAHASWATVFWVNLPLGLIASAMLAVALKEQGARRQRRIDYLGSVLMMAGTGTLMFVLVQASRLGPVVIVLLCGFAVATLIALVVHEARIRDPMVPISLWRDRIVVGGNLVNLLLGGILMGITAFLPPYVQGVMGRTALVAGFMLTAMSASWPTGSALAGHIMQRTSYRATAVIGGVILVAGSLMLALIAPERSTAFVALAALISGFGMGLSNNSHLVAVQSEVAPEDRGVATSSLVFMRMVGQSIGTAVFGGIVNAQISDRAGGADLVDRMLMPEFRQSLPMEQLVPLLHDLAGAIRGVFEIDALLAAALFACCLFLPRGVSPVRRRRG
ncbi:MAG TPA: MDR family MFS transporter [Stellaceae bacterium]|nr:MDR family MFS transporter [Stellaceae bacterium]